MGSKSFGNPDSKEKARELTEKEKARLERFEALAAGMVERGYRRTDLTVGIVRANIFAVLLLIPLFAAGLWLFYLKNGRFGSLTGSSFSGLIWFLLVFAALIVVHELIHGAGWALCTGTGFRDISFGFMKQYLTPYCSCAVPLTRGKYIFGALLPLILLGIVPMIVGILIGSMPVLFMGIIMTDSAAGDIMIVWNVLRYRSSAGEVVYIDHPTQAGGVIFER